MIGSFNNHLLGGTKGQPTPEVGMGCTILLHSDRHACTITKISEDGKMLLVQRDKAIRTDGNGMSECQEYRYERDPDGAQQIFHLNKRGQWVGPGGRPALRLGDRCAYYDFSF